MLHHRYKRCDLHETFFHLVEANDIGIDPLEHREIQIADFRKLSATLYRFLDVVGRKRQEDENRNPHHEDDFPHWIGILGRLVGTERCILSLNGFLVHSSSMIM